LTERNYDESTEGIARANGVQERKMRPKRIWRTVLVALAAQNPPRTFSAMDVAEEFELSTQSAAQLLKRLRAWGKIRLSGFEPSESGMGRRRMLFEVTADGRRAAAWKGKVK